MISSVSFQNLKNELKACGLDRPRFAIVLPLVRGREPSLLIEVRAAGISQAGDPCFPGGKIEPGETPAAAAARELKEELGIEVSPEDFLGQLPTVRTHLGALTNVFVCSITPEQADAAVVNHAEVAKLLNVPLSYFLASPHAPQYPVNGHIIWGLTAGAIRRFCAAWQRAAKKDAEE